MKTSTVLFVPILFLLLFAIVIPTQAQTANPQDTLNQYVADLQKSPDDAALRQKIIAFVQTMSPVPGIPEEANHHYVRASVFVKQAKADADYELAVNEYRQVLLIAPWWGSAYYNLAMVQRVRGRFDEATVNLKLCLLTNMNEKDAKEVQDALYAIEVEKELDTKRKAEAQAAADKQRAEAQAVAAKQKEEADWKQLTGDLANWDKQAALAEPWACTSGLCSAGNALSTSNGALVGTVAIINVFTGGSQTTQSVVSATIRNGVVEGQVQFPGYTIGQCTTPGNVQDLSGTLSADNRTLDLKTTYVAYYTETQGMGIFAHCTSVSEHGTSTIRFGLSSQAPPITPMLALALNGSTGFLHVSQTEAIKLVLAHGGNLNTLDSNNNTALHIAAQQGNQAVVALLLQMGAQVNAENKSLDTPLSLAVASKSIGTVQVLLEHGAKPDARPNAVGFTPLYLAVWQGDTAIAAALLKYTTDQNQVTVALYFTTDKNLEITKLLLARGANVNIVGGNNATPLAIALVRGCGDAYAGNWVKKPDDKNFPCSPTAVIQTVTMLLEHGAKVDIPEHNGLYPLMRAARTGNLDLVKVLIAHGADINVKDTKGHSVLQYAKEGKGTQLGFGGSYKRTAGNEEVIKFFESQGLKK
jgi:ankyrin repeat protein